VEIKTREAALRYLDDLAHRAEIARQEVDSARLVQVVHRKNVVLMQRYGQAVGALCTLMHVRLITPDDYAKYIPRLSATVTPQVVANV
jgi:hypothetical protein